MKKNKIIVIGGGYGGLRTVERLAKNHANEIILFDKNPYHFMQTDVYDLIANEEDFARVTVDLFTFCSGFEGNVTFFKQEVKNIDFHNKKVITDTNRYGYDYLVLAVGARTKFTADVKGLSVYAYGIKALHRAMFFKQKFEMSLFNKVQESGASCTPINIVVAGAGLSGVEIAAQMASFSKEFYKKNNFICRKLNIVLISSKESVLYGMDSRLVNSTDKRLKELGIVVKYNKKVVEVTKDRVVLNNGEDIYMDFMIYTGGVEPNGLIHTLSLQKSDKGYIATKSTMQSYSFENVFAIGDCTAIYNDEKVVAPTADVAEQTAEICAKNIQKLIDTKPLLEHDIRSRGVLIALGRGFAAAKIHGFFLSGRAAYIMKKIVEKVYAKRLDLRSHKGCRKIFCE